MTTDLEGAIRIEAAAPDSHFRLLACPKCNGDNVAYVQYLLGVQEPWKVLCFDCGHTVDKEAACKHDAQGHWNEEARNVRHDQKRATKSLPWLRIPVSGMLGTVHETGEAGVG